MLHVVNINVCIFDVLLRTFLQNFSQSLIEVAYALPF